MMATNQNHAVKMKYILNIFKKGGLSFRVTFTCVTTKDFIFFFVLEINDAKHGGNMCS